MTYPTIAPLSSLLEQHQQTLYKWARRLTKRPEDADDLVQEVNLHCLRSAAKYRGEAEFSTWLYRITVNSFKDRMRNKQKNPEIVEADIEPKILEHAEYLFAQKSFDSKTVASNDRVNATLLHLSPHYRDLLRWKYIEGLSYGDIADQLHVKKESAYRSMNRVRRAFKRTYK